MSTKRYLASLVVVGCAVLVVPGGGCDRDTKPKATTNTPAPPPTAEDMATLRDRQIAAAKAATQQSAGAAAPATQPATPGK